MGKKGSRRRGGIMVGVRKVLKATCSIVATSLKLSPVLIPVGLAVQSELTGKPYNKGQGIPAFVFEASGYQINEGVVNNLKVQQVIIRDILLVGLGFGVAWVGRHA